MVRCSSRLFPPPLPGQFTKRPKRPCLLLRGHATDAELLRGFAQWFQQDEEVVQVYAHSPLPLPSSSWTTNVAFLESRQAAYPSAVVRDSADLSPLDVNVDFLLVCGETVGSSFPPLALKSCEIFFVTDARAWRFQSHLLAALDAFSQTHQRLGK